MSKIHEKLKKISESKILTRSFNVVMIILATLIVFTAGMATGFKKASFGRAWGEHYVENFGMGHREGRMGKMMGMGYFPNAHGAIGRIIKIELPNIIVQDKDGIEKVIVTKEDTGIEKVRELIKINDLIVDDFVVIVGSPNDAGQIEAKFIRVMPKPALFNKEIKIDAQ